MGKRFRVAFSFAGEKRSFVAKVAEILTRRFGLEAILYDKYHEAEFAVCSLAQYLPNLYNKEADLVVVVFCGDYNISEWCGLEWNATYGLLMQGNKSAVLLSRFDYTEPEGLYQQAGFIELDDKTPAHFAELILQRLAINEGLPRDYYVAATGLVSTSPGRMDLLISRPELGDSLALRCANHKVPQEAFLQLLSPEAPFQLLLIKGETQTGKTHLSKQFLGAALNIPGLRCGRFDFKGSVDMEAEVRGFAELLNLAVPPPGPIASRLAEILVSLRKSPRPTLLIFDTFEAAGEAEEWMSKSLLLAMMRSPWLRIVIAGQRTSAKVGEAWETRSSDLIQLRLPTPEEWLEYGLYRQPELTIDKVRWAYSACGGRSSVLAQLLDSRS
jgi:hypothetical protein